MNLKSTPTHSFSCSLTHRETLGNAQRDTYKKKGVCVTECTFIMCYINLIYCTSDLLFMSQSSESRSLSKCVSAVGSYIRATRHTFTWKDQNILREKNWEKMSVLLCFTNQNRYKWFGTYSGTPVPAARHIRCESKNLICVSLNTR